MRRQMPWQITGKPDMPLIRSILHMLWLILTVIPWALFVVVASLFVSSSTMYWMCARWLKLAVDGGAFILGIRNRITGMENLPTGETARPCCWSSTNPPGRR